MVVEPKRQHKQDWLIEQGQEKELVDVRKCALHRTVVYMAVWHKEIESWKCRNSATSRMNVEK